MGKDWIDFDAVDIKANGVVRSTVKISHSSDRFRDILNDW